MKIQKLSIKYIIMQLKTNGINLCKKNQKIILVLELVIREDNILYIGLKMYLGICLRIMFLTLKNILIIYMLKKLMKMAIIRKCRLRWKE